MTKKDYVLIAAVLRRTIEKIQDDEDLKNFIINEFAYQLQKENPRFDIAKFKHAIYGTKPDEYARTETRN